MDSLKNLLQIIDENSQVKEQTKSNEPDYQFMGNPPGDPTYKTDPKTGNLIPDIDPNLRPNAPVGPIPGTKLEPGVQSPPSPADKNTIKPIAPVRPSAPQSRPMPTVPAPGGGVRKVSEQALEETVDKIIKLIQVNDQLVRENKKKVNEKYMGFDKTVAAIEKGGSAENPEAVAASIGREKYGGKRFQAAAAAGKKLGEQQGVAEGIFDKLKQTFLPKPTPMPRDGDIIRVIGREVKINHVPGGYIGFTWRDKEGIEHTEEVYRGDYRGAQAGKELIQDIAAEIKHADNPGPMDPGVQAIIDRKRAENPQLDDIMRRREKDEEEKTDFATMRTSSTIHEQGVAEAKADTTSTWVVYDGDKVKRFKTREGATAHAQRHGGKVASSAHYADKIQGKQSVTEGPEESPRKQMGQEMQNIINRIKQRMKAADRQYTVPSKPETAQDLRVRIDDIKNRIAQAKQKLDPNAQYSDDNRVYRDYYREPMDTLRDSQNELAVIQARLEKMSGSQ